MTDGQWAPKSDFLGFNKQHNNSNYSRSKSCGRVVVTSSKSDEFSGGFGGSYKSGHLINSGGETTSYKNNTQQPKVATSLDALLADLDTLTTSLPDLKGTSDKYHQQNSHPKQQQKRSKSTSGYKNKSEIKVEMPATNSINIQLSAPSKPPADRSFDRQPHGNHSLDIGHRRNGGMANNGGRNGNGQSYEDDLDYVLEKNRDGSPVKDAPQPYHSRFDSKPFSYIRQNPSKPNSRLTSRTNSREALDATSKNRELESPSLLRRILKVTANGGNSDIGTPPDSPLPPFSTASNSRQQSISPVSWSGKGQPDWVNNQTCPDQNTWTNSYKLSADQKQNGSLQKQNGSLHKQNGVLQQQNAHTINTFKQTENIYSRIGQANGDGRAASVDQERVIPVQIERESRATERVSRPQERSTGMTNPGVQRSHSLGRHEYNGERFGARTEHNNGGERFGARQTIQIQTRDKSAYGRLGETNGSNNGMHHGSNGVGNGVSNGVNNGVSNGGGYSQPASAKGSRTDNDRMDWLLRQQRKLVERRNSEQGAPRSKSSHMVQELKSSFVQIGRSEPSDGYASDANSFHISADTSRESSPSKQVFNIPVHIESRALPQTSMPTESRPLPHNSVHTAVPQNSVHTLNPVQPQRAVQSYSSGLTKDEVDNSSIYSSVKKYSSINRQTSETSYDRSRPSLQPRNRHESESEAELENFRNGFASSTSINGSRPNTPGFPLTGTPLFNQSTNTLPPKSPGLFGLRGNSRFDLTARAGSPAGSTYQGEGFFPSSRRGSVSSEPTDVPHNQVKLVRDNHKFWYKKNISRDEAITILNTQSPGTFIVRDSNSFPGAFGLALKVATPPIKDASNELVRHFLIEPTSKGVKLKGYSNEPVFASLSALIYQHTVTPLALPCKLVIPSQDLGGSREQGSPEMNQLLQYGAACNVYYLFTQDTDLLTGPQALKKTVSQLILTRPLPVPTTIHFKVSGQGITLTDQSRRLFFRKHYPVNSISHCGVDPEDRRWNLKSADKNKDQSERSLRVFGFVARKTSCSVAGNQCHVFAELDSDQPARAIVNFVNKLMAISQGGQQPNSRHADMV